MVESRKYFLGNDNLSFYKMLGTGGKGGFIYPVFGKITNQSAISLIKIKLTQMLLKKLERENGTAKIFLRGLR